MTSRRPHLLSACAGIAAAVLATNAAAQVPCDSLHGVTFYPVDQGNYQYGFSLQPMDANDYVLSAEWAFLGEEFLDHGYGTGTQTVFPSAGTYLVCVQASLDGGNSGFCEAIHCELVPIPVDAACADLIAEFTIGVEDGGIRFIDLSSSPVAIGSHTWDFGDGSTSYEASPLHAYDGTGPYEACLTVTAAGCSATVCNWVYLGPSNVPCSTLLQPAISVIQYQRTVAAFDESITSGMNTSRTWDFGDGMSATGNPVIHTYAQEGTYLLCGAVDLWGPLTPDTCQASACELVHTLGAAGIGDRVGPPALRAWPQPFGASVTIEQVPPRAPWQVMDLLGRTHLAGSSPATGPLTISTVDLPAGAYIFRTETPGGALMIRLVKGSGD